MSRDVLIQVSKEMVSRWWFHRDLVNLCAGLFAKPGILVFGYIYEKSATYNTLLSYCKDKRVPVTLLDIEHSDYESRSHAIKELKSLGANNIMGIYFAPSIRYLEKCIARTEDEILKFRDADEKTKEFLAGILEGEKKALGYANLLDAEPPTIEEGFSYLVTENNDEC